MVLKPASATPLSALFLAALEEEAGLPPGWLNVVAGSASEIGDVLVEDERVKLITFTGSGGVGWGIAERAHRKRVKLELGNATPAIVCADAPAGTAAKLAANAFSFAGQSCISVQRIFVLDGAWDSFVAEFVPKVEALVVGDPADETTDVGPVISGHDRERILEWVRESKGEVLTGGETTGDGLIRPTVIANPAATDKVQCEEVFGPVVTLTRTPSLDEAIDWANSTRYGLQAAIFSTDIRTCLAAAQRARVRRRDGQRGADVPRRPDAVRRREGVGEHARGPRVGGARDDRGTARRPSALGRPRRQLHSSGVSLFRRRANGATGVAPRRAHAGVLRRERRALLKAREDTLRDLGGLLVEMYRRGGFRDDLLQERAAIVVGIDARLGEIDELLHGSHRVAALRMRHTDPPPVELLPELRPIARRLGRRADGDRAGTEAVMTSASRERRFAIAAADGACPRCGARARRRSALLPASAATRCRS